jgi:APA family basic amino acid/polyamine antiporter
LAGIFVCGALMIALPVLTWIRFFVWLLIGLAIYFLYGRTHSSLAQMPAVAVAEDAA